MSVEEESKGRPSSAPGPSRSLSLDLLQIWDVCADARYDVVCHRPERRLITIRTCSGVGELLLEAHPPLQVPEGSFITIEQPHLRRYRTLVAPWRFWWFEYRMSDVLPLQRGVPFQIEGHPADAALLEEMFVKLQNLEESERRVASSAFMLLMQRWLAEVRVRAVSAPHQRVIEAVIDRIRGSLSEPWPVSRLVAETGLCETLLRREFRRVAGLSPAQFILQARLHAAVLLIQEGIYSLSGIADQLHFSSAFHLSAAFKKHYGVSPSQWR